eukprot:3133558-Pyramimonas_sp.AAC.3
MTRAERRAERDSAGERWRSASHLDAVLPEAPAPVPRAGAGAARRPPGGLALRDVRERPAGAAVQ